MRGGEMGKDKPPSKKDGSPGRTRTSDPAVNSRLLYRLSYRGTVPHISSELRHCKGRVRGAVAPPEFAPIRSSEPRTGLTHARTCIILSSRFGELAGAARIGR